MGALKAAEEFIGQEPKRERAYLELVEQSYKDRTQDSFNQVRYMIALANNAFDHGCPNELIFTGGLGVLGHIVKSIGVSSIPRWRGTRDIDLILRDRQMAYLIDMGFDTIDFAERSTSIPNKLTIRGDACDQNGERLGSTVVDAFYPNGDRNVVIEGRKISQRDLERKVVCDFFGVPVNVLPIDALLKLKLDVHCQKEGRPRPQDCEDVVHLVALAERGKVKPTDLRSNLDNSSRYSLRNLMQYTLDTNGASKRLILIPGRDYRRSVVSEA